MNNNEVKQSKRRQAMINDTSRIVSEMSIGRYQFRITENPYGDTNYVLSVRDTGKTQLYQALGSFPPSKADVAQRFMVRYATNPDAREKIEKRRFERWVETLEPADFDRVERLAEKDKEMACRTLFNLDPVFKRRELDRRRRLMARKFHPDMGGNARFMALINSAYDCLVPVAV